MNGMAIAAISKSEGRSAGRQSELRKEKGEMENLKLGRVRTRHIAYAQRGGKNEPIGEIDEAHLRAYVASLPGSYTVPNTPHDTGRSAGFARQKFNNAVLTRIGELRSANPELTELELHRLATAQVSKENPLLLSEYRADVQRV